MISSNVYYGAKRWEYEIKFNSDFSKIVDGVVRQYNEKNQVVKIELLLDSNQFYELQIENPAISRKSVISNKKSAVKHENPDTDDDLGLYEDINFKDDDSDSSLRKRKMTPLRKRKMTRLRKRKITEEEYRNPIVTKKIWLNRSSII